MLKRVLKHGNERTIIIIIKTYESIKHTRGKFIVKFRILHYFNGSVQMFQISSMKIKSQNGQTQLQLQQIIKEYTI